MRALAEHLAEGTPATLAGEQAQDVAGDVLEVHAARQLPFHVGAIGLQQLRALRPYIEDQLARGVYLKHITRHLLGLFAGERGGRAFRQVLSEGAHKPGADWSLIEQALALTESFSTSDPQAA